MCCFTWFSQLCEVLPTFYRWENLDVKSLVYLRSYSNSPESRYIIEYWVNMNHQTQRRNHIRFYSLVSQSRNRQSRASMGTPPRGQVHDLFQLTTTTSQDVAPSQGGCLEHQQAASQGKRTDWVLLTLLKRLPQDFTWNPLLSLSHMATLAAEKAGNIVSWLARNVPSQKSKFFYQRRGGDCNSPGGSDYRLPPQGVQVWSLVGDPACLKEQPKKEEEPGCWEITGSLSFSSSLILWSSAFPLFHVVSISLADGLVIRPPGLAVFPKN